MRKLAIFVGTAFYALYRVVDLDRVTAALEAKRVKDAKLFFSYRKMNGGI
jgi:hypothetical protein